MAPISRGLSLVSVLESVWLPAALGISFPMHSLPRSPEGSQGHSPLLQSPAATCSCQQQLLLPGWEVSTGHTPQGPEAVLKPSGTTLGSEDDGTATRPRRGATPDSKYDQLRLQAEPRPTSPSCHPQSQVAGSVRSAFSQAPVASRPALLTEAAQPS